LIGVGQGIALPSLMGVVLQHIRPERAGAAAGVLTTTQQFGIASGVAVVGAVFYGALGSRVPSRGTFVSAMEVAMTIDVVVLAAAAAITMILPRRAARPQAAADRPVHVAE
jgi:MFS family permease